MRRNHLYRTMSVVLCVALMTIVISACSRVEIKKFQVSPEEIELTVGSTVNVDVTIKTEPKDADVEIISNPKEYLGLDDSEVMEIDPIEFGGYKFSDAVKIKKGGDGLFRSNLYEKATIFFTRNEVHMYKAFFNSISGVVNETTEVLFYSDIVSVSTDNETEKICDVSINYLRFVLTSTGGKQFSVALLGNDNRQRSINAMRALIKEKNSAEICRDILYLAHTLRIKHNYPKMRMVRQ